MSVEMCDVPLLSEAWLPISAGGIPLTPTF